MRKQSTEMLCLLLLLCGTMERAFAQDDVPSQDIKIGNDEHKRYFLIGPQKEQKAPDDGYGLVVILPGGTGDAQFHPFVKRIFKNALPAGYVVAQPVAVKWTNVQKIVWPTGTLQADKMQFSTEEFVADVIKDVKSKQKIDPKRVFTLSWSSGGPAGYAISLANEEVTGSFVAMSVFKPIQLGPLTNAKGHAYYIYHSAQDKVCPIKMAEQAAKDLARNGAKTEIVKYSGGHGWRGDLYSDIRKGIEWLEKNHADPTDSHKGNGVTKATKAVKSSK